MPGKASLAQAPAAPPARSERSLPRAAEGSQQESPQPKPGDAARRPHREPLERCWRSPLDPARWYGTTGDLFYKIALSVPPGSGPARRQDLLGEARLLRRCRGIAGVPELVDWREDGGLRVLVTRRLEALPLSQLDLGWGRLFRLLPQLLLLVVRLAWRGVSHDDLRPENILLDDAGRVHLVDFDQASTGRVAVCLARSLFGLRVGRPAVSNAILAPVRERLKASLPPPVIWLLKGRHNFDRRPVAGPLPPLPPSAGPELRALHAAWLIAAASGASSPDLRLAYYQLEFQGLCFPGERSWAERWRALRAITPYRGRRVLDLGCNLGLLPIFLLRETGASAALAVDRDGPILAAATEVARAFRVQPEFRRVDFDRDPDWEVELLAFQPDVVFALSILNWVADRARLLAFLGRCDELIYEGHDSALIERRRLRAVGFTTIDLVATSERGRPILHGRKEPIPG
jgi:predicted Ser/Thr protein kinase/predicted RNA methylase